MGDNLQPTERYDGTVSVIVLGEDGARERHDVHSYEAAIELVKERAGPETVCKIEGHEGQVVFDSQELAIENWEKEWRREKRRLSVDVDEHECPYDAVGCVADDLCVQCKMDRQQQRIRD
jgi:hypothetical protein